MVLWKKTMVLYYTENYRTSIYEENKHGRLPNTKKLWFIMETLWKYTKIIEVLNRLIALELWFTIEKLWYYGKKYGTMEKTMVLWKKLWYYTENYGTLIYYGKNYGTMEKTMVL